MSIPGQFRAQAAYTAAFLAGGRYLFALSLLLLFATLILVALLVAARPDATPPLTPLLFHLVSFLGSLWFGLRVRWDEGFFAAFAASDFASDLAALQAFDAWRQAMGLGTPKDTADKPENFRSLASRARAAHRLLYWQVLCLLLQVLTLVVHFVTLTQFAPVLPGSR